MDEIVHTLTCDVTRLVIKDTLVYWGIVILIL